MALYPAPDNMDVVVTSELMEAGRMLENGMVTSDRTTLIASSHRVYSILERSAMGDGLFDDTDLKAAATKLAKRAILSDMAAIAKRNGTVINAVMLGVLAGSDELPIPARHLLPQETYFKNNPEHLIYIFTTRGCPFKCIFCQKELTGRGFRVRSTEAIVDELEKVAPIHVARGDGMNPREVHAPCVG